MTLKMRKKLKKKNEPKKYNLNILYYDENLKNKENNDNCTFFEMNTYGTFYGCHYFELFKTVCKKIKNNKKEFILISSGSCAQKIFNYCSDIDEIREYFIYCFNIDKYKPLMKQYSKLKEVYCDFESLKQKLYNIKPMINDNIVSSNLIYFEDYSRKYIKLHYEFIRKYQIYKILKKHNYTESEFLELVKKKHPNLLNLAKQIFPNKNETINFFKNNIDLTKEKGGTDEEVNEMFKIDDNNLDDNIKSYINNYTKETFYYKYLNKFLREGNFDAFRILSSHLSKFIFKLYEYREKNKYYMSKKKLYRKMYLDPKDIKLYKESKGKVICYPAFTSTSLHHKFMPNKWNDRYELVLIEIEQNNTKSVVSISKDSVFQSEQEYLFLPFSFFKIKDLEIREGTLKNPHIIYLIALNSEKPIEQMFSDFMEKETDNLNPEGLDLLVLHNNKKTIEFNKEYLSKEKKSSSNNCLII